MNEHTIVNGIFAVIAIVVLAVRVFRKVAAAPPATNEPARAPVVPNVTGPASAIAQVRRRLVNQPTTAAPSPAPSVAALERPPAPPRARFVAAPPAAEAFSVLDLILPDAEGLAQTAPVRRRGRSMLGTGVPGSAAWGAGAIIALEILGPPVSLRPGATLGAPHAF